MAKKPAPMFGASTMLDDGLADIALDDSPVSEVRLPPPLAETSPIDLTGKPKIIFRWRPRTDGQDTAVPFCC